MSLSRTLRLGTVVALLGTSFACAGCGGHGADTGGARDVSLRSAKTRRDPATNKAPITQAELQQDMQRFAGNFLDRLVQSMGELLVTVPEHSEDTLRRTLLYGTAALDIATGPLPEVNLLDMLVFMRLSRETFETHWMPEMYGEKGKPALEAFRTSERELLLIAAEVLTPEQLGKLDTLVARWREENPNLFRVESVRLMDFSVRAGTVEMDRAKEAGGLLSSVKQATQAADQALLLAERGVFVAQRMPFLLRLQARLGTREIVSDALGTVSPSELMTQVKGLEPMVDQLPGLVEHSGQAAHEARLLVKDVQPLIPSAEAAEKINDTIARTNELTLNTRQMLHEMQALIPGDTSATVTKAKRGIDDTLKKGLLYLVLLGAAWSVVWWGGYYLVKRRLRV